MPYRAPGSPARGPRQYLTRPSHQVLPSDRRSRRFAALIDDGFQAFNAGPLVGGLQDLRGQDARAEERHDDRADDRRRDDAGRPRRLRHRDDGARAGRLPDQHRRESVPRSALRAELHAAPRVAVSGRSRSVRGRRDPDLRRAVSGHRAARDRRVHPRVPRAFRHERPGVDRRSSTTSSARICSSSGPAARSTRSWRAPRSSACRSTRRRPATARSA